MPDFFSNRLLLLLTFFLVCTHAQSQENVLSFTGRIIDGQTKEPIPYATIVAISNNTQRTVAGTTSDDLGEFVLASDSANIRLEVRFIGFKTDTISTWNNSTDVIELGTIELQSSVQDIDAVKVTAEKSSMEFKLDKRVFHVGKDISSTGMGALEVLNNVPSVNVDIEGNVSLRGNAGVQILIDGKPSAMSDDPAKVLGTLTADMIESIEVITNPSAKYEAGGTSGIINIILKKEEKKGLNGSVSVNTGIPQNHSLGGSINYRTQKFNLFTQFGAGYRSLPDYSKSRNESLIDSRANVSETEAFRNETFGNLTLGADYFINKYNTITLSGNFAYELEDNPSESNFLLYDTAGVFFAEYTRTEETTAENPKYQYDLQYKKQFKKNKEHLLSFSTQGRFFGKDQRSEFLNRYTFGSTGAIDQRTQTYFYQADYTYRLDYVNPLTKLFTLEAGAMYDINDVGNDYAVFDYGTSGWQPNQNLTNEFEYNQKVLGAYGTMAYEKEKWGLKLGLRAENTDLTTRLVNSNETNEQHYTNLFPSVHTSYKFSKRTSIQAGYSRRIFRPRLWDLNPFFNIQNNYNIRTGNPNLLPEFGDSYELTSIFFWDKVSLNMSLYYLYTTDVTESISYFSEGINYTTKENIGTNRKTGFEINGKYSPTKWFTINGDFNWGYFYREGEFNGQVFDFEGRQWSSKFTAKFKLSKKVDFELSPNIQSAYKTVQGTTSGFVFADAGIRWKVFKDKAVVNFAVRDIFASRIRETEIHQSSFYAYNHSMRGRFMTLGFSYSFGKGEVMTYSGGGRR